MKLYQINTGTSGSHKELIVNITTGYSESFNFKWVSNDDSDWCCGRIEGEFDLMQIRKLNSILNILFPKNDFGSFPPPKDFIERLNSKKFKIATYDPRVSDLVPLDELKSLDYSCWDDGIQYLSVLARDKEEAKKLILRKYIEKNKEGKIEAFLAGGGPVQVFCSDARMPNKESLDLINNN